VKPSFDGGNAAPLRSVSLFAFGLLLLAVKPLGPVGPSERLRRVGRFAVRWIAPPSEAALPRSYFPFLK
jgi:hypothetical protein